MVAWARCRDHSHQDIRTDSNVDVLLRLCICVENLTHSAHLCKIWLNSLNLMEGSSGWGAFDESEQTWRSSSILWGVVWFTDLHFETGFHLDVLILLQFLQNAEIKAAISLRESTRFMSAQKQVELYNEDLLNLLFLQLNEMLVVVSWPLRDPSLANHTSLLPPLTVLLSG